MIRDGETTTLAVEAATFLEADGWLVTQRDQLLMVGSRPGLGDMSDQVPALGAAGVQPRADETSRRRLPAPVL